LIEGAAADPKSRGGSFALVGISRQRLTIRGWTPISLAVDQVLRPLLPTERSEPASNRAATSPVNGNMLQAPAIFL